MTLHTDFPVIFSQLVLPKSGFTAVSEGNFMLSQYVLLEYPALYL